MNLDLNNNLLTSLATTDPLKELVSIANTDVAQSHVSARHQHLSELGGGGAVLSAGAVNSVLGVVVIVTE